MHSWRIKWGRSREVQIRWLTLSPSAEAPNGGETFGRFTKLVLARLDGAASLSCNLAIVIPDIAAHQLEMG